MHGRARHSLERVDNVQAGYAVEVVHVPRRQRVVPSEGGEEIHRRSVYRRHDVLMASHWSLPATRALTAYLVGLGAAVAGLLAASWWTLSHDNPLGFAVSMGGYAVVLSLLVALQRRARSTPRGFKRIYAWGLGATMALYVIGIMWFSFTRPWLSAAVFLPYCLVVALPAWFAAVLIRRAAR